jgi:hypothetical protein
MTQLEGLLVGAAELLQTDVVEDPASQKPRWYLEVNFKDGRKQRVYVDVGQGSPHYRHVGDDQRLVYATSRVGTLQPGLDAVDLLRKNSQSSLASVSIFYSATPDDPLNEMIYTTAGVPLGIATPGSLAALIDEVAGMADAIEEELFGVDEH